MEQTISIIAAMGKNREIGDHGKIPWHLPADFANFKRLTTGHSIIMGRKTYESIGKPLPNRRNIIITRQHNYRADGAEVVSFFEEALKVAGSGEVFVIGGAEIYREAIPLASRIYLTLVDAEFPADTFFPEFDPGGEWCEIENIRGITDEKNPYRYRFTTLEKIT